VSGPGKNKKTEVGPASFAELIEGDPHTRRLDEKKVVTPGGTSGRRRPPSAEAAPPGEPTSDDQQADGLFRGSISPKEFRDLRRGRVRPDGRIDLHRLDREHARHALRKAFGVAAAAGTECVLVIHGRGRRSPAGEATLKSALPSWLRSAPLDAWVRGFAPALPRDGGDGATYVLLRNPNAAQRRKPRR